MQTYTLRAVLAASNTPLGGASISVYLTGTTTLALIYDDTGASIANPLTADEYGLAVFRVANGTYDIVASSGDYVGPTQVQTQIYDLSAMAVQILDLQGSLGGGAIGFSTLAAMNADLNYPANTLATVFADSTPSNNGTYLKLGASGSGSWSQVQSITIGSVSAALTAETNRAEAAEALLAPLASPTFTGNPTVPNQTAGSNNTRAANTAYVDGAVSVETARAEAAEALRATLLSPGFTGTPTAPTQTAGDNSTKIATTGYTDRAVGTETTRAETAEASLAPLASPALSGTPTAPTQAALDNSTKLATTAYADRAVATETTRAEAAEAANTTAISNEVSRAEGVEATLTTGVAALAPALNVKAGFTDQTIRLRDPNYFTIAYFGPNGLLLDGKLDLGLGKLVPSFHGAVSVVDALGFLSTQMDGNGVATKALSIAGLLSLAQGMPYDSGNWAFRDPLNAISFVLTPGGRILRGAVAGLDFSEEEIYARNAAALAKSALLAGQSVPYWLATPSAAYNVVTAYGQSLCEGYQSWPAKTVSGENRADVLMIGQSVRPAGVDYTTSPTPVGDTTIRPAVATTQSNSTGAILSPTDVAALSSGDIAAGEEIALAATIFCRDMELGERALASDTSRQWLVTNVAVGGRSIEQLSKGASPNLYNRLPTMATAIKTAAGASSVACVAFIWNQGEYNYNGTGSTDKATYETNFLALVANFNADVSAAIYGQTQIPAVFLVQTGATWTVDATGLSIGQAQLELSLNNQGYYLVCPYYPVTDRGGHLGPNGSRWIACQIGKVMYQVLIKRKCWRPLSPLSAELRGRTVLVSFHVPCPPLQFQPAYEVDAPVMRDTKGFRVYDTVGEVPISDVSIFGDTVLAITLTRAPNGAATLYAGRLEDAGSIDLCDSDPTIAPFNYEYSAGSGDYVADNITALVGKPYPLWNWCVAFNQPIKVVN